MSESIDFDLEKIRNHKDGQHRSFEDLCCYLFRRDESVPQHSEFRRIEGKGGDGGVEAIHQLPNGEVWGCQAKYMDDFGRAFRSCKKSFNTALSVYNTLSKYVICVPFDLTGDKMKGRNGEQIKGKWSKYDNWKKELQNEIPSGRKIDIELWCEDDLKTKIIELENTGSIMTYWFNEKILSDEWFARKLKKAIFQAGDRYSPEIHVDTPLNEKLHYFGQTPRWKESILKLSQDVVKNTSLLEKSFEVVQELKGYFEKELDLVSIKTSVICNELKYSLYDPQKLTDPRLYSEINELEITLTKLDDVLFELPAKNDRSDIAYLIYSGLSSHSQNSFLKQTRNQIGSMFKILDKISELYSKKLFDLAANKIMLIEGEAGIGKTHGIVNLAEQRASLELHSLVFFGEDFYDSDPWMPIINYLGVSLSSGELLELLNIVGEVSGYPLIIFIDALNESNDQFNWQKWLPQLSADISNFRDLKLCVSCRDISVNQVIPKSLKICKIRHEGFSGNEINAQISYWNHYCPNVPKKFYFHKEFSNPLFLRIFFESLHARYENIRLRNLNENIDYLSFNSIVEEWIESKNIKIANKLDYDVRTNLVSKAMMKLAEIMIYQNVRHIPIEDVYLAFNDLNITNPDKFLRMIEDESLVSEVEDLESETSQEKSYFVRFTYERIGDTLVAEVLTSSTKNLKASLKPGQSLHKYVADEFAIYENSGIIEALSIRWPEKTDSELIDSVKFKDNTILIEHFISSINWRNQKSISKRTIELLSELLENYNHEIKGFECLLENSTKEGHPLNAEFLHSYLIEKKMVDRDGFWVDVVGESFSGWSNAINIASPVYNLTDINNFLKSNIISENVSYLWGFDKLLVSFFN